MFGSAPTIVASEFPKAEQEHIYFVNSSLSDLNARCLDLEAAIALFDMCRQKIRDREPEPMTFRWMHLAARESASAVYRFREDMEILGVNLNKCPTLLGKLDKTARRAPTKQFKASFPDIAGVRTTGQHGGVIMGSPEKMKEHAAPGPILVVNSLMNSTLTTTFEKKVVTLDITAATLAALVKIRDLYWDVFRHLDPFSPQSLARDPPR